MSRPQLQSDSQRPTNRERISARRAPRDKSVSLRHSASNRTHPPKPASTSPNSHNISSEESTNPERWFDKSNEHAENGARVLVDNDPPYFPKDGSSGRTPPDGLTQHPYQQQEQQPQWPFPILSAMDGLTSSNVTDDYRSVIDDLTVENKRLKRRLKKYRHDQKSADRSDKMFEVKMHGLNGKNKRELEDLLRTFAAKINNPTSPAKEASSINRSETSTQPFHAKPILSHTSTKFADSGYGSMAVSNQASTIQASGTHSNNTTAAERSKQSSRARSKNIHSYLQDIPAGLMPRQPSVMTERARKNMVVSRLEQLFGGRGATAGEHQLQVQQQEVSRKAASDEKSELEASGHQSSAEGIREAHIMDIGADEPARLARQGASGSDSSVESSNEVSIGEYGAQMPAYTAGNDLMAQIEQRPTRPLDLDPQRASVPAENVKYIRHLGFPMPDADSRSPIQDDQGWVYLNLLTNLAQLHTVNVTPAFVRQAILECSSKLELSSDQRKIRWRGASEKSGRESGNTADRDGSLVDTVRIREDESKPGDKRARPIENENDLKTNAAQLEKKRRLSGDGHPLQYIPITQRLGRMPTQGSSSAFGSLTDSPYEQTGTGESSVLPSSTQAAQSQTKGHEHGAITFFNHADFYTDLSGDLARKQENFGTKSKFSTPLGVSPSGVFPSHEYKTESPKPIQTGDSTLDLALDTIAPLDVDMHYPSDQPSSVQVLPVFPEFEASGLGNVYPADHFNVKVTTQNVSASSEIKGHRSPTRLDGWLSDQQQLQSIFEREVIARQVSHLKPSDLPPPTFAFTPDDTNSSDMGSNYYSGVGGMSGFGGVQTSMLDDSDVSPSSGSASKSSADMPSVLSKRPLAGSSSGQVHRPNPPQQESSGSVSGMGQSQIVDMLATARAVDPQTIMMKEREYDAQMAQRLAEEIPAGSSAATRGGGSGFNSPEQLDNPPKRSEPGAADGDSDDSDEDMDDDSDADVDSTAAERPASVSIAS